MHLPTLQSDQQMFSIVSLAYPERLASLMGLDINLEGGVTITEHTQGLILTKLVAHTSAVIVEPSNSFPVLLKQPVESEQGLVMSLARTQLDPQTLPQLNPSWGVEEVANNYGVAYLKLWYNPAEIMAIEKKKIVAELHDHCQHLGVDLILDISIFLNDDQPPETVVMLEAQQQAISELQRLCELMVIQYPGDALAAATLTAELDVPWIVSLQADSYEQNKQELRTSLENGAQGFLIENALWQEIGSLRKTDMSPDIQAIEQWLATTGRDRVIELVRITNEFGKQ